MSKPDQSQLNLSGGVITDTNPGTAGGTRNYINIGGLKICWGSASGSLGTTAATTFGITFPTSFFSTTPVFTATVGPNATTNNQILNIAGGSLSASSVGINILSAANTSTEFIQWIAIGT